MFNRIYWKYKHTHAYTRTLAHSLTHILILLFLSSIIFIFCPSISLHHKIQSTFFRELQIIIIDMQAYKRVEVWFTNVFFLSLFFPLSRCTASIFKGIQYFAAQSMSYKEMRTSSDGQPSPWADSGW